MPGKFQLKAKQLHCLVQIVTEGPLLHTPSYPTLGRLLMMTKHQQFQLLVIAHLAQTLHKAKSVIVRLKCLALLHKLLLRPITNETTEAAQKMLIGHINSLSNSNIQKVNLTQTEEYLSKQVEIPYLHLLRKISSWKLIQTNNNDLRNFDTGFSLINKIKEILQFRKVFLHYGCYYPSHAYALNLFEVFVENIQIFWKDVCQIIKATNRQAIESNLIEVEGYLLITEGEQTQETILQFVYGSYFSERMREELEIKNVRLLKAEIQVLQNERRKKESDEVTMQHLKIKRERRKTVEKETCKVTAASEENDRKINTDQEIEALEFILEMEDIIKI